jgi:hypothetical protein
MAYSYKVRLRYAVLDVSSNPPTLIKDIFPTTWETAKESTLCSDYCIVVFKSRQSPVDLGNYIDIEETETTD